MDGDISPWHEVLHQLRRSYHEDERPSVHFDLASLDLEEKMPPKPSSGWTRALDRLAGGSQESSGGQNAEGSTESPQRLVRSSSKSTPNLAVLTEMKVVRGQLAAYRQRNTLLVEENSSLLQRVKDLESGKSMRDLEEEVMALGQRLEFQSSMLKDFQSVKADNRSLSAERDELSEEMQQMAKQHRSEVRSLKRELEKAQAAVVEMADAKRLADGEPKALSQPQGVLITRAEKRSSSERGMGVELEQVRDHLAESEHRLVESERAVVQMQKDLETVKKENDVLKRRQELCGIAGQTISEALFWAVEYLTGRRTVAENRQSSDVGDEDFVVPESWGMDSGVCCSPAAEERWVHAVFGQEPAVEKGSPLPDASQGIVSCGDGSPKTITYDPSGQPIHREDVEPSSLDVGTKLEKGRVEELSQGGKEQIIQAVEHLCARLAVLAKTLSAGVGEAGCVVALSDAWDSVKALQNGWSPGSERDWESAPEWERSDLEVSTGCRNALPLFDSLGQGKITLKGLASQMSGAGLSDEGLSPKKADLEDDKRGVGGNDGIDGLDVVLDQPNASNFTAALPISRDPMSQPDLRSSSPSQTLNPHDYWARRSKDRVKEAKQLVEVVLSGVRPWGRIAETQPVSPEMPNQTSDVAVGHRATRRRTCKRPAAVEQAGQQPRELPGPWKTGSVGAAARIFFSGRNPNARNSARRRYRSRPTPLPFVEGTPMRRQPELEDV